MKVLAIAALTVLLLTGCATTKDWEATGGSRADGVVSLSYEEKRFGKTRLDEQQEVNLATQRCQSWGYTGAVPFGGVRRDCSDRSILGRCTSWTITKDYQCTGATAPTRR